MSNSILPTPHDSSLLNSSLKQRLVAVARAARILPLLDAGRYALAARKTRGENKAFLAAHERFAAPPLWWMHDMYRHTSFETYWRTGRETADAIAAKIEKHVEKQTPRVADWGCGLARVVRHLPAHYQRTGFDYNARAIEWDKAHIPDIRFLKNDLSPPLPAGDAAFDALYALSVFTHLSLQGHARWIAEIERVLVPGGVFLGAFHMTPAPDQLLPDEQARFDAGELVIRGGVKEGSRIFTAHHPERYLRETLLKNFDILEAPSELLGQTLFVARKR